MPKGTFILKILLNHPQADLEQEQLNLNRLEEHAFPAAYYLLSPGGSFWYQDEQLLAQGASVQSADSLLENSHNPPIEPQ